MLAKLLILAVFLGISLYERELFYIFHIVGIVLIGILNLTLLFDLTILMSVFSLVFGIYSIIGYNRRSMLYIFAIVIIGLICIYKIYKSRSIISINYGLMTCAVGTGVAILYVFILELLGFKLNKPKKKDETKKQLDHVCGLYKEGNFVKIV